MDICVGNLPSNMTGNSLREVFESFGRVETADVVRHRMVISPGDGDLRACQPEARSSLLFSVFTAGT